MTDEQNDQRRYARHTCLKVGHVISFDDVEGVHIKRSVALTKNFSAGGLLFTDTTRHGLNDLVLLEIDAGALSDNELRGVVKTHGYVLGKVVRVETADDAVTHCYGISFVTIGEDESYLDIFQELLNRIEFSE